MLTKYIIIFFLILFSTVFLSNEMKANEIDYPISVNLVIPILSNLSQESLKSILFNMDFVFLYQLNSFLRLGLYADLMSGITTILSSFEALFWILLFPISFPLDKAGIWTFPEFQETVLDYHFGIFFNTKITNINNLELDFICKIGYGIFICDLMNYDNSNTFFVIPKIILKFPLLKGGGIGINIGYQFNVIAQGIYKGQIYYFPQAGLYFYFNNI